MYRKKWSKVNYIRRSIDAFTVAFYTAIKTNLLGKQFSPDKNELSKDKTFISFGKLLMRYLHMVEVSFGVRKIYVSS